MDLTDRPWAQADHPISKTTTKVWLPRPGGDGASEEAEEVSAVYHQSRKRTREEGGETIVEDQDLVFTERRVTWPSKDNIAQPVAETTAEAENGTEGMETKVEVD